MAKDKNWAKEGEKKGQDKIHWSKDPQKDERLKDSKWAPKDKDKK